MFMEKRITEKECEKLYKICSTPPHVIAHCSAVSHTAVEIGRRLNNHGFNLDLDLIRGAGLSHDIARTLENHGEEGAKYWKALGIRQKLILSGCICFMISIPLRISMKQTLSV